MSETNFDERAKDWDSDPMKVERARVVAEAIRAAVPLGPGTRALEYGCGTGLLSFALQPYLTSITLADTSQGMLDVLEEKIKAAGVANMFPVRLDLSMDPLPAARYHVIYLLMTLHHIPDTDGILRKFHALLEPDGHLCIADLEKEDGSFHGEGFGGHNGFDCRELQSQVERAGFPKVIYSRVFELRRRVGELEKGFPLFLMTAQKGETGEN
jgi:ubiquinone/menaquinone biosynthesis C-methylase UbiE